MADPPIHFFKFVAPGFKFNLSIPSFFLTQLNCGGCSKATLSRGRHEWSVDIEDGVFGDGWRRFVRENGVQEFDFIVFKHQGGMMFDFLVFDQSTCDRQYPNISDEMDVEELPMKSDTIRTHRPMNLKKHKRNDYASQKEENFQVKKEPGWLVDKATSSTLNNRPCFISNLKAYSFQKSALHLPSHFMKQSGLKIGEVILIDDTDRSWRVQLNKKDEKFFKLGSGLKAFLVAKGLNVGDAFKFELVEKVKNKPPVVKFSCLTPVKEDVCRYFMLELTSSNIQKSNLYLPLAFALSNGLINKKEIILKYAEDGMLWKAKLRSYKRRYFIVRGWKEFHVAHGLKEGDCLKLKVVDKGEKPIVNVYLQKKTVKAS